MPEKPKERKRVTGLRVHEISFVDDPAVPAAKFVIVKRQDGASGMEKFFNFLKQTSTQTQSLIMSRDRFKTAEDARKWIAEQDGKFSSDKMDETEDTYRFRQMPPGHCQEAHIRTIELTDGVKAVICRPKPEFQKGGGDMSDTCQKCGHEMMPYGEGMRGKDEHDYIMPKAGEGVEEFLGRLANSLNATLTMLATYLGKPEGKPAEKATKQECPEGQEWDDVEGKCIDVKAKAAKAEGKAKAHEAADGPVCPEHYEWDEEKGRCVSVEGEAKAKAKAHEAKPAECPEGQEWDEKEGKCVEVAKQEKQKDCPPWMEWDEEKGKCVPKAKEGDKKDEPPKDKDGEYPAKSLAKAAEAVQLTPEDEQRVAELLKGK